MVLRPLQDFITGMTDAWEAVTPSSDIDTSSLPFRCVDSFVEERGAGRHREFMWHLASNSTVISEPPLQTENEIQVTFFFHKDTFRPALQATKHAFLRSVHEDISTLRVTWSALTQWNGNPGVLGVNFDGYEIDTDQYTPGKNAGGTMRGLVARVTFKFRVLVSEGEE